MKYKPLERIFSIKNSDDKKHKIITALGLKLKIKKTKIKQDSKIKFSVIMPTFNRKFCISNAIDSLLENTYNDFELIIVDDASTDKTKEYIYEKYSKEIKNKKINYIISQNNGGPSNARNIALRNVKNDWIAYLDSDNTMHKDFLETFATYIKKYKNKKCFYAKLFRSDNVVVGNNFDYSKLQQGNFIDIGVFVHHKDLIKFLGCFDTNLKYCEDWDLILRYTEKYSPIFINKVLLNYSNSNDYTRITSTYENTEEGLKSLNSIQEKLIKKENPFYNNFLENIFSVKNNGIHKIWTLLGIRLKLKSKKLMKRQNISCNSFWENIFSVKNCNMHKIITLCGFKLRIRNNNSNLITYVNYILNQQYDKTHFINLCEDEHKFLEDDVKLVAMYLPQFHDFEENVKWFGRGFTEWSNTSKTVPQYIDHWQPHIPIDVGYYNLNDNFIMKRQIELAKKYGIYGFCFYYYWFSGDKLMEKPLQRFLDDKSLDMPFFLFWANEDWTRLWGDGRDGEVLHKQELLMDDAEKFMKDALPYMQDSRYIKINNCPLLILYDPQKYPYDIYIDFITNIRNIAKDNGFNDLHILTTTWRADGYESDLKSFTDKYYLDGLFEFYPQGLHKIVKHKKETIINPKFKGVTFDIENYIKQTNYVYPCNTNLYKGIFPNWDNTSRKAYSNFGCFVYQNTPNDYKTWLKDIIKWTKDNKPKEEQFIFINAWNEWAEGAHLEPDQKFGYAYLQATKEALEETHYEQIKS